MGRALGGFAKDSGRMGRHEVGEGLHVVAPGQNMQTSSWQWLGAVNGAQAWLLGSRWVGEGHE